MIRKEYWPRSWDHFTPFPKPGANKDFSDYFFEELNTAVFFDHQNNNMAQNPSQVDGRRALHWIFKWVLLISQSGSCKSLLGLLWKGTPDCATQTTEMCCPTVLEAGRRKSRVTGLVPSEGYEGRVCSLLLGLWMAIFKFTKCSPFIFTLSSLRVYPHVHPSFL